jgi:formate C-acetyltransferase
VLHRTRFSERPEGAAAHPPRTCAAALIRFYPETAMNAIFQTPVAQDAWRGFAGTRWREGIDVRDFIQSNFSPYAGDAAFLSGPTPRTTALWAKLGGLLKAERAKGVLDVSADTPAAITAHEPGYIDRDAELIVGLQTDAPLKRAIMPNGGLRMVEAGLEAYGFQPDARVREI